MRVRGGARRGQAGPGGASQGHGNQDTEEKGMKRRTWRRWKGITRLKPGIA